MDLGCERVVKRVAFAEDVKQSEDDASVLAFAEKVKGFDQEIVTKAEDAILLTFVDPSRPNTIVDTTKPMFMHQLFVDSLIVGFENCKVELQLNSRTWQLILAQEHFSNDVRGTEVSKTTPLQVIRNHECTSPLFAVPSINELNDLPGTILWKNADGFALRWNNTLNEACKVLLQRGLALSTFFIETASQVDVDDEHWKLLLLTCSTDGVESLVGFTSVFEFPVPITDKRTWRVCVMLVLPRYQRRGLGKIMYQELHKLTLQADDIVEMTVEHPCEGFSKMRRIVEVGNCMNLGVFFNWSLEAFEQSPSLLARSIIEKVQPLLKVTEAQLQFCFECAWLWRLEQLGILSEEDKAKTKFRLSVKDRIRKRPGDLIVPDKDRFPAEYKTFLQEEYLNQVTNMSQTILALGPISLGKNVVLSA